jgi:hypothetical protein
LVACVPVCDHPEKYPGGNHSLEKAVRENAAPVLIFCHLNFLFLHAVYLRLKGIQLSLLDMTNGYELIFLIQHVGQHYPKYCPKHDIE